MIQRAYDCPFQIRYLKTGEISIQSVHMWGKYENVRQMPEAQILPTLCCTRGFWIPLHVADGR